MWPSSDENINWTWSDLVELAYSKTPLTMYIWHNTILQHQISPIYHWQSNCSFSTKCIATWWLTIKKSWLFMPTKNRGKKTVRKRRIFYKASFPPIFVSHPNNDLQYPNIFFWKFNKWIKKKCVTLRKNRMTGTLFLSGWWEVFEKKRRNYEVLVCAVGEDKEKSGSGSNLVHVYLDDLILTTCDSCTSCSFEVHYESLPVGFRLG